MDFVRKKKERILNVMETLGQGGGGGKLEMGRITQVEKLKLDTRTADHLVEMSSVLHF